MTTSTPPSIRSAPIFDKNSNPLDCQPWSCWKSRLRSISFKHIESELLSSKGNHFRVPIAKMVQIQPPSPPSYNGDDLVQHSFQHLVHHNATTSFPRQNFDYDVRHNMISGSGSSFASPPSRYQDDGYYYNSQQPPYSYQNQYQDTGLGIIFVSKAPQYIRRYPNLLLGWVLSGTKPVCIEAKRSTIG